MYSNDSLQYFIVFVFVLFQGGLNMDLNNVAVTAHQLNYENSDKNLTKITWAHAVNDKHKLTSALNSDIMMLEADVVLGVLITNPVSKPFPIMAHPPNMISDLSLETFLKTIYEFNEGMPKDKMKGIKLDFKSIDAFEQSIEIINKFYEQMSYPVWINADILSGPIDSKVKPVDPIRFLTGAKQFQRSVLSIGWTTRFSTSESIGSYTENNIDEMIQILDQNDINQNITFPIRAGIAAQSFDVILKLVNKVTNSTISIWSSDGDPVNVDNLRKLIFAVGLDRTYVDVPQSLKDQLHLDQPYRG